MQFVKEFCKNSFKRFEKYTFQLYQYCCFKHLFNNSSQTLIFIAVVRSQRFYTKTIGLNLSFKKNTNC